MLAKLKPVMAAIWADLGDTYKRLKILIIAVGAAVIYLEWNKISQAVTLAQGKKEIQKDQKEDQTLAAQETGDNQKADALIADATKLAAQQQPVSEDWYEKDKK